MKELKHQYDYSTKSTVGKWTLISTILASSMAFIDSTALNVILPSLQSDLDASGADVFWVLNSYLLMLAALIIVGGSLGDKLGRVKIFKLGIAIFTLGSILCGLSPSVKALIAFRTIQGIGGALMIPGSLSIIAAIFDFKEKGKAIGTWSAFTTVVTICGPVLGGALADLGLWRLIFFINVPLSIGALIILHLKVPESLEEGESKIDWKGAISLMVGLGFVTFGLLEMPELGYTNPIVLISIVLGILSIIAFIRIEKTVEQPMMPLSLFSNQTFAGVNLLAFFLYAALGGMMLFLSLNIIQIQGYSQLEAGLTFLPFSFMMILLARKMGVLADKYGPRNFLIFGCMITAVGMLLLAMVGMTEGPSDYWLTYFPGFIVFALGMSMTVVPLTTAVMKSISEEKSGIGSGINNSITRIASVFINAILGALAIFIFSDFVLSEDLINQLDPSIIADIKNETYNLGEAKAPVSLSATHQNQLNLLFKNNFIKTYKIIGYISASLALIGSLTALIMVKPLRKNHDLDQK